ncbi:cysteine protease ATG4B-like isoform X2 [Zingiber officinale]|uniref:cysteine protease ATG4B-like isoform X2 n=1 Tax=Zingiber officinale TaxID=94328 RepID=UPI001C4D9D88|nr:cysteine protease ATG4B-like isoform X2 [Zingiber officinale]XP_042472715.1 cysteine protease ATG4B-like isoform X2 [Zingiber officinale]
MTELHECAVDSNFFDQNSEETVDLSTAAISKHKSIHNEGRPSKSRSYGWTTALKKLMGSGPMRRLQDRILGSIRTDTLSSASDIWCLGKCYKLSLAELTSNPDPGNSFTAFLQDFSSRIWITYRKGFEPIGDSKFTCDVNWGCMIRSSQMLIAQALIVHHMGRSWRKPLQKPYDLRYLEILHLFGDSSSCAFSIHNLLEAGKAYGLVAGSWLGPYAMCRTWETIINTSKEQYDHEKRKQRFPMVLYIVSGDKDGEQGGAPVVCIEVASRLCHDFTKREQDWAPILLLVPLVLGLEKINPRYIPLLWETFTFPQCLGILGGKPGASTYIVGVQDEKALYLDPHEVQSAVDIKMDDLEADCSSYHCSTVRHLPLDAIDPSLAIGFYCKDKDDFEDFCSRSTQLADKSSGAPLFTVIQNIQPTRLIPDHDSAAASSGNDIGMAECQCSESFSIVDEQEQEDEWQIL